MKPSAKRSKRRAVICHLFVWRADGWYSRLRAIATHAAAALSDPHMLKHSIKATKAAVDLDNLKQE